MENGFIYGLQMPIHSIRKVLKACLNKPLILVDVGKWYPLALSQNAIERYFRTLKERLKAY